VGCMTSKRGCHVLVYSCLTLTLVIMLHEILVNFIFTSKFRCSTMSGLNFHRCDTNLKTSVALHITCWSLLTSATSGMAKPIGMPRRLWRCTREHRGRDRIHYENSSKINISPLEPEVDSFFQPSCNMGHSCFLLVPQCYIKTWHARLQTSPHTASPLVI